MAVNEGLKPVDQSQVPVDPNVRIPDHVRAASEAAEAIHKQAYTPEPDQNPPPPAAAAPPPADQNPPPPADQNPPPPAAAAPPAGDDFHGTADATSLRDSEWARRYNSMHGRWQASERARAAMEQQMSELGQELVRTQTLVQQMNTQQPAPRDAQRTHHNNLITEEDRSNYGDELIDLARRAAMDTVGPEVEALREENQRLTNRVKSTAKRELFSTLDGQLPQWRTINQDFRFKSWLRLPNIYTGRVRQEMLKEAVDGADAPKVLAFFNDFLREAQATGQMAPAQQVEQQLQQPAPHQPAVALETLAAPGRARPSSGDTQVTTEKPIYSRADITKFYADSRKGFYAGRQAEYDAMQADLTRAQAEGRIRG